MCSIALSAEAELRVQIRHKTTRELKEMWQILKDKESSLLRTIVKEILFERGNT